MIRRALAVAAFPVLFAAAGTVVLFAVVLPTILLGLVGGTYALLERVRGRLPA